MAKQKEDRKQFVVGDISNGADFSPEYIETLIYKIALWYNDPACDRTYEDPVSAAREKVQQCLLGETEDGSPWRQCPREFSKRVRAKCAFDIETDKGIPSRRAKNPLAQRALSKEAQDGADALGDFNIAVNGFDQIAFRTELERDILSQFPELDNPAHIPNVRSLTMYYAEREKIDRELQMGVASNKRVGLLESLKTIEAATDVTLRRLGIHPDQVRKKVADKGASTVSDLAAMVDSDEDFKAREKVWALQTALQFWWMSQHVNGRGDGPQIHDFEIWHATRSRPIKFRCRHGEEYTIVEGFEPHELLAYLEKEGVNVEEPVIPYLMSAGDLKGMREYLTSRNSEQDGINGRQEENVGDGAGSPVDSGNASGAVGEPG
jgi:hypothetical protein